MLITKVSRTYSRSINAKNYNVPESWIRVESTYEATVETGDDPVKVSEMVYEQAKQEVIANIDEIVSKMREQNQNLAAAAAGQPAYTVAPMPVGTEAPAAPVAQPRPLG